MDRAVIVTSIDPNYGASAVIDAQVTRLDNTNKGGQQNSKQNIFGMGGQAPPQGNKFKQIEEQPVAPARLPPKNQPPAPAK